MKRYFVNVDECIEEYFDTLQEAIDALNVRIQDYCTEDGWPDEEYMNTFFVGEITHRASQTNVQTRPPKEELDAEMVDKDGVHWCHDFEETCDYEVKPVTKETQ